MTYLRAALDAVSITVNNAVTSVRQLHKESLYQGIVCLSAATTGNATCYTSIAALAITDLAFFMATLAKKAMHTATKEIRAFYNPDLTIENVIESLEYLAESKFTDKGFIGKVTGVIASLEDYKDSIFPSNSLGLSNLNKFLSCCGTLQFDPKLLSGLDLGGLFNNILKVEVNAISFPSPHLRKLLMSLSIEESHTYNFKIGRHIAILSAVHDETPTKQLYTFLSKTDPKLLSKIELSDDESLKSTPSNIEYASLSEVESRSMLHRLEFLLQSSCDIEDKVQQENIIALIDLPTIAKHCLRNVSDPYKRAEYTINILKNLPTDSQAFDAYARFIMEDPEINLTYFSSLSGQVQLKFLLDPKTHPRALAKILPFVDIAKLVQDLQKEEKVSNTISSLSPEQDYKHKLRFVLARAIAEEFNASFIDQFLALFDDISSSRGIATFLSAIPAEKMDSQEWDKIRAALTAPEFLLTDVIRPSWLSFFLLELEKAEKKSEHFDKTLKCDFFRAIIENMSFNPPWLSSFFSELEKAEKKSKHFDKTLKNVFFNVILESVPFTSDNIKQLESLQKDHQIDVADDNVRSFFLRNMSLQRLATSSQG